MYAGLDIFQPTHSVRSATSNILRTFDDPKISTHALRAECDYRSKAWRETRDYFNPRTPCGVRLSTSHTFRLSSKFQPTHSVRSATATTYRKLCSFHIVLNHFAIKMSNNIYKMQKMPFYHANDHCFFARSSRVFRVYLGFAQLRPLSSFCHTRASSACNGQRTADIAKRPASTGLIAISF